MIKKIINVGITLAKCICNILWYDYLKNNDTIKKIVSILRKDKLEVSQIIDKLDIENINVDLNISINKNLLIIK